MEKEEINNQVLKSNAAGKPHTEVTMNPIEEYQPQEETVDFAWSAGWALFFSGCLLFVPLIFAAILPNVSSRHHTYNNTLPAWFSRGILLYLTCVLAVLIVYRRTCKKCGMPQLSWVDKIEDTLW